MKFRTESLGSTLVTVEHLGQQIFLPIMESSILSRTSHPGQRLDFTLEEVMVHSLKMSSDPFTLPSERVSVNENLQAQEKAVDAIASTAERL